MSEGHRFSLRKMFCALPAAEQVHCHLVVLWNDSRQVKSQANQQTQKWSLSYCICAGARAGTPRTVSKTPAWVNNNTIPAIHVSSGSRLWASKRSSPLQTTHQTCTPANTASVSHRDATETRTNDTNLGSNMRWKYLTTEGRLCLPQVASDALLTAHLP